MASRSTLLSSELARLPLMAGAAVAGRKQMGTAGLRQPAAHSSARRYPSSLLR